MLIYITVLTLVTMGALFFILPQLGQLILRRKVAAEVEMLFTDLPAGKRGPITASELDRLPPLVGRWLERAGAVGKEPPLRGYLQQRAEMRLERGGKWMRLEAEQHFRLDEPGFIWLAKIRAAPFIHIAGRDILCRGEGNMLIKPLSLFTVADARGRELSLSSLHRYLAELVWFPRAALSDYLEWKEVDERTVEVTINYRGSTLSGRFHFNEEGLPESFSAMRYMESKGEYRLFPWRADFKGYKNLGGVLIPTVGEVRWELEEGEFYWLNLEVTHIDYEG